MRGIEPPSQPWEGRVLPLYYIRSARKPKYWKTKKTKEFRRKVGISISPLTNIEIKESEIEFILYYMLLKIKNQLCLLVCLLLFISVMIWWASAVRAEIGSENEVNIYNLKLDEATLFRGYTASLFENNFRVGIFPGVLSEETKIIFKELTVPEKFLPIPDPKEKKLVSYIFEFDIENKAAFHNEKPVIIEIKYPADSNNLKKIYFWDKGKGEWRELPSKSIVERNVVRAPLHLPYARLAIFEDPNIMEVGVASWYKYRGCNCAASPDWPKGSQLKVTNLYNDSYVVVTVNDYGPDRSIHPDRVIDLDLVAFEKLASRWFGLIKVKVEKL